MQQAADADTKGYGQQHLYGRADQGYILDRDQVFARKFKAQGEQQQGHAYFRQFFNLVDVGYGQAAGVGPEQHAGENIAQDQRLTESLHQQAAKKGDENKQNDVGGYTHGSFLSLRWLRPAVSGGKGRLAHVLKWSS